MLCNPTNSIPHLQDPCRTPKTYSMAQKSEETKPPKFLEALTDANLTTAEVPIFLALCKRQQSTGSCLTDYQDFMERPQSTQGS